MIESFSHIYLPVRDIDESIDFYTNKLGFTLSRKWRRNDRDSSYVQLGGLLLELSLNEKTPSTDGRTELRIGLKVDDMTKTLEDLRGRGVEVAREPWDAYTFWGKQCQIKDPNGYLISLREWQQGDGPTFPDWQPNDGITVRIA